MIADGAPLAQYWRFKIREAGRSFFYVLARHQAAWLLFLYLIAAPRVTAETAASEPGAVQEV
jgi:uncharacterized membrane protein